MIPQASPAAPAAPAPAAGMPPRPPANVGGVTVASANHGNQAAAMAAIKNATELLQQAMLQMPLGSDGHTDMLGIVKKLSKMTSEQAPDPQAQMQSLIQMAREASQRGTPAGLSGVMPAIPAPQPAPAPAAAAA